MPTIHVDGRDYEGVHVKTAKTNVLLIQAGEGFLGCGYFDVGIANKVGDAVAIVTGVKTFDDMLGATVVKASEAAEKLNVKPGITGREALRLLGGSGR
jgi:uncharacterized protein YunC (DUF1805 family)